MPNQLSKPCAKLPAPAKRCKTAIISRVLIADEQNVYVLF